ncbi:hypothetical protein SADUNF_Sadunf01G0076500 [Salix dunnii]|uniref:Membrane-associated kinase regulator 2 n=1 Tax=Salix dunnii TaxID=1413687 RepID=A0A835NAK1_9ROSI|nr:hypothetical protein SADUNF_Sadunf01G0076500 [Salix dunnii]
MEAFSLLKYWRGGGTAIGGGGGCGGGDGNCNVRATKPVTAGSPNRAETDDENDNDDGPFFDLEFAVPDEEEEGGDGIKNNEGSNGADAEEENDAAGTSDEVEDDDMDEERGIDFTLSSASSNDRSDLNLALSPSDDLFFKGRLVPIEASSLEPNSKSSQFSVSILKSAVKFRVFMLGLKKKQNTATTTNEKAEANVVPSLASSTPKLQREKNEENGKQSKLFTVKFKVEEVPVMSLFTRDNSKSVKSSQKPNSTEESTTSAAGVASSDEKQKFSKDVMQKYLQKVKPLYIRVSKRYGEKLKLSGQLSLGSGLKTSAAPPPSTVTQKTTTADKVEKEKESVEVPAVAKGQKQGNLPSGLRDVCKHLGKRRSASSAAAEAAPPGPVLSNRRDDSLLQQHDGIQSAILHCKRSFNASRDSDSSVLSRSVSDPSHEKSIEIMSSRQIMKGKVLLWTQKSPENEI